MATGLLRASAVYGASNVLQRAIPFLLLPVLSRYLSKADFGSMAMFAAVAAVATPLIGFNVSYGLRRRYYDLDRDALGSYIASCLAVLAAGSTAGLVLVGLLAGPLQSLTALPRWWLMAAVAYAGAQVLILLPLTLWQVEHAALRYGTVQVIRSAALAGLTVVLVIVVGLSWQGAVAAMLATSLAVAALIAAPSLRHWIRWHVDAEHVRHALSYGGGLIPHTLGALAITNADRFFITHHVGAEETGVYWVGYQFGFIVALVADAFNRAWTPWLFERLEAGDGDRAVVRRTYAAFLVFAGLAAIVTLAAPAVVALVLDPEVAGAERFVGWIALGFAFNGMYRVIAGYVYFFEKTVALSAITGLCAVLNLGLNAVFVPRVGAIGAAQATAAAFLLGFVLTWLLAQRVRPMPWLLGRGSDRAGHQD